MYTVWFRHIHQDAWYRIDKVKEDSYDNVSRQRILITCNGYRLEVPLDGTLFKFSSERVLVASKEEQSKIGK